MTGVIISVPSLPQRRFRLRQSRYSIATDREIYQTNVLKHTIPRQELHSFKMHFMEMPLHLILDILDLVYYDLDVEDLLSLRRISRKIGFPTPFGGANGHLFEGFFESEATSFVARKRLRSLSTKFGEDFCRYDIDRDSHEYLLAKSFQLRLVVENVEQGILDHDHILRKFIHQVADDLYARLLKFKSPVNRRKVLQDVCKVALTHRGCWYLLNYLGSQEFDQRSYKYHGTDQDLTQCCFVIAIGCNYAELEASMLEAGFKINFKTTLFGGPLEIAARFGNISTFTTLLGYTGIDKDGTEARDQALYAAATHGKFEIVKLLITPEQQLAPNSYNPKLLSATHAATRHRYFNITRLLLDSNHESETKLRVLRGYICCAAARHGNNELVLEIIKGGINLNEMFCLEDGGSLVSIASRAKQASTVHLLLDHGALVKTIRGRDAFVEAAEQGNLEMIELMCQRDLHKEGRRIRIRVYRAFLSAVERGHLNVTRFLFSHLSTKDHKNAPPFYMGFNALSRSISHGQHGMIRWLVEECGLSATEYPDVPGNPYASPMFGAIKALNVDTMILLFRLGAKPLDLEDPMVQLLLQSHRDIDIYSETKTNAASELNNRWKQALEAGISKEDFFGPLESTGLENPKNEFAQRLNK